MAKEKGEMIVSRNTAVSVGGIVQQLATALYADTVPIGTYLLGFQPESAEGERLLFLCEDNASREANQHFDEPFHLHAWAAKKVGVRDQQTGEEIPAVRTILIDPDGETLAFVSKGAAMSLDMFRTLKGDGPFNPPIPIIVKEVTTRAKFRLYKFLPVSVLRNAGK